MKQKILFSLTAALMLTAVKVVDAGPVGTGISFFEDGAVHATPCCPDFCPPTGSVPCADYNTFSTMWFDPGMIIASGLDLLATYAQNERSIDCQDALDELEASLESGCSGSGSSGTTSSLSGQDSVVLVPNIVLDALEDTDSFEDVRKASEDFLFYTDDCQDDCVLERQNTWLLTSVSMAAASGDKLLATSADMNSEYTALQSDFNSQTSPKGMWGSSSKITLHTHVQQNDINALYARDLEMNALSGVRESEDVRLISR